MATGFVLQTDRTLSRWRYIKKSGLPAYSPAVLNLYILLVGNFSLNQFDNLDNRYGEKSKTECHGIFK